MAGPGKAYLIGFYASRRASIAANNPMLKIVFGVLVVEFVQLSPPVGVYRRAAQDARLPSLPLWVA